MSRRQDLYLLGFMSTGDETYQLIYRSVDKSQRLLLAGWFGSGERWFDAPSHGHTVFGNT
mgnify:CR=1 FL=1